jgi:excisionase family DNA binding protein
MTSVDDAITERVEEAVSRALAPYLERLADQPLVVTTQEAARMLNCSRATIDRLVHDGTLPMMPFGESRRRLIPREAVVRLVSERVPDAP